MYHFRERMKGKRAFCLDNNEMTGSRSRIKESVLLLLTIFQRYLKCAIKSREFRLRTDFCLKIVPIISDISTTRDVLHCLEKLIKTKQ